MSGLIPQSKSESQGTIDQILRKLHSKTDTKHEASHEEDEAENVSKAMQGHVKVIDSPVKVEQGHDDIRSSSGEEDNQKAEDERKSGSSLPFGAVLTGAQNFLSFFDDADDQSDDLGTEVTKVSPLYEESQQIMGGIKLETEISEEPTPGMHECQINSGDLPGVSAEVESCSVHVESAEDEFHYSQEPGPSGINNQYTCPVCDEAFPGGNDLRAFNDHIDQCLLNSSTDDPKATYKCPVCHVVLATSLEDFNSHVDSCLNKETIREIIAEQSQTDSSSSMKR